jgi:hypothetical protein
LNGVETDDDSGNSHWEPRILRDELMANFNGDPQTGVYSDIIKGLLKDTGWYGVSNIPSGAMIWFVDPLAVVARLARRSSRMIIVIWSFGRLVVWSFGRLVVWLLIVAGATTKAARSRSRGAMPPIGRATMRFATTICKRRNIARTLASVSGVHTRVFNLTRLTIFCFFFVSNFLSYCSLTSYSTCLPTWAQYTPDCRLGTTTRVFSSSSASSSSSSSISSRGAPRNM